ncbi:hypothetical protein WJX81_001249 [Elliptochloris bilobata]|uniref:Glucosamine/galactosamine-6-phosphate isomerase domain-containing protein n=1 Tax=Elliptochloris bilobata TaxID=381761 RepID=A0AAW1S7A6_9CHLO
MGLLALAQLKALSVKERVQTHIFPDAADVSEAVATLIKKLVLEAAAQGQHCVLGLATGSTPKEMYRHLVRMHRDEELSFKHVITFNLDEYLGLKPGALQSYRRFMQVHLFDHIDILPENTHVPDGSLATDSPQISLRCNEYERLIADAGGIDLQLLGLGRTGHIGFNERGSSCESRTRRVALGEATRIDAAADFFGKEHVPRYAISMGAATILQARRIVLMAFGEGKAAAVAQAVEGPVTNQIAASFLQDHPSAALYVDLGAAAGLTRQHCPWTVTPLNGDLLQWDTQTELRAAIWLARRLGRPLMRLRDSDYRANSLQDLVEKRGSAEAINERVFGALVRTVTSCPGTCLPARTTSGACNREATATKNCAAAPGGASSEASSSGRALVMSPHPDDDVISMGGTLAKLVQSGLQVHVAYQTSGSIAVWDHDARRFAAFAAQLPSALGLPAGGAGSDLRAKLDGVAAALDSKAPGEVDTLDVQRIKALIREGEAVSAASTCGVSPARMHFLDMPFYKTGMVEKEPLSDADVALVVALLERVRPCQLYAAGDLSDPHGTHRTCLQAILRALDIVRTQSWFEHCRVWLYRGAWQEWEPAEAGMVVPLTPREMRLKVDAIQRHQSQKDRPLFPGADLREFWQRALFRNEATAQLYNTLGLPEYEAMEAFVEYDAHSPSPLFRAGQSQ